MPKPDKLHIAPWEEVVENAFSDHVLFQQKKSSHGPRSTSALPKHTMAVFEPPELNLVELLAFFQKFVVYMCSGVIYYTKYNKRVRTWTLKVAYLRMVCLIQFI